MMNPTDKTAEEKGLQFSYSFSDWAHAFFFYNLKKRANFSGLLWPILIIGIGLYELLIGFVLLPWYGLSSNLLQIILGLLLVTLGLQSWFEIIMVFVVWRRYKRRGQKPTTPYEFWFNETLARYRAEGESGLEDVTVSWTKFSQLMESRHAFVLAFPGGGYWALPKRHFPGPPEIEAFRDLANRKVSQRPIVE